MKLPRIAEPLRHRDFRLLWIGQTLTLFGTFVSQVAWPFQLLQLGGSALELGTLAAIFSASSLVFLLYLFALGGNFALILYGLLPTVAGAILASVVLSFTFVGFGVLWECALQRHVPRGMLGRVTRVDWFGGSLLGPVAPVVAALLAQTYGPTGLFLIAGTVATVLAGGGLFLRSIRELE